MNLKAAGKQDIESEAARIEREYRRRDETSKYHHLYSALNPAALLQIQSKERQIAKFLKGTSQFRLGDLRLLDVGCGSGGELLRLIGYGFEPRHCCGVDLSPERIQKAMSRLPEGVRLHAADAAYLPFADAEFDLITQFMLISSVVAGSVREKIASEIWRALRPSGYFLSYDFWINPVNKETRPLKLNELRRYFPDAQIQCTRITLAPPIARRLQKLPHFFLCALESVTILNTHLFVAIRKP